MKGQEKSDFVQKITSQLDACITALVTGRGTDERLHEIEMKIKFLNSQLVLLVNTDPIFKDQSGDNQPTPQVVKQFDWNKVVKSLRS